MFAQPTLNWGSLLLKAILILLIVAIFVFGPTLAHAGEIYINPPTAGQSFGAPAPAVAAMPAINSRLRVVVTPFSGTTYGANRVEPMSSALSECLAEAGFMILAGQNLGAAQAEIQLSNSQIADPATRQESNRIAGAQYVIVGSVQRPQSQPGNSAGNRNLQYDTRSVAIAVDYQMIKVVDREVVATGHVVADGESQQIRAYIGRNQLRFGSSTSPMEKAIRKAAVTICDEIVSRVAGTKPTAGYFPASVGRVVECRFNENDVVLSIGSDAGVQVGATYSVEKGSVFGSDPTGWIVVVTRLDVSGQVSYAVPIRPHMAMTPPEAGDLVVLQP